MPAHGSVFLAEIEGLLSLHKNRVCIMMELRQTLRFARIKASNCTYIRARRSSDSLRIWITTFRVARLTGSTLPWSARCLSQVESAL